MTMIIVYAFTFVCISVDYTLDYNTKVVPCQDTFNKNLYFLISFYLQIISSNVRLCLFLYFCVLR